MPATGWPTRSVAMTAASRAETQTGCPSFFCSAQVAARTLGSRWSPQEWRQRPGPAVHANRRGPHVELALAATCLVRISLRGSPKHWPLRDAPIRPCFGTIPIRANARSGTVAHRPDGCQRIWAERSDRSIRIRSYDPAKRYACDRAAQQNYGLCSLLSGPPYLQRRRIAGRWDYRTRLVRPARRLPNPSCG